MWSRRVVRGGCALALVLVLLAAWRLTVPGSRPGAPVAVVLVAETGNALLPPWPVEPWPVPASRWREGGDGVLWLPRAVSLAGSAPLLVLHRVEHLDVLLAERAFAAPDGVLAVPLHAPLVVPGWSLAGGRAAAVADLADDAGRLLPPGLVLRRHEGAVRLAAAGEEVLLRPGEAWGEARLRRRPGAPVERVRPGADWRPRLQAAWAEGAQLTVLRVRYLGTWPADRVRAGGGAP